MALGKSRLLHQNSEGITYPLFTMLSFATIALMAMVIDHSRQSLAFETLQRSADAAALSSARRLDGRKNGWVDAKKAAVLALKQNPIHGVSLEELSALRLDSGTAAHEQTHAYHPGIQGRAGRMIVTVERGVLWFDHRIKERESTFLPRGASGGYRFISLEQEHDFKGMPIPPLVEGYVYANAVRVQLRLESLATTVGRLLGVSAFTDLERTAIAVTHEALEVPVAPFAIPLCSLRLNLDPYAAPDELETAAYDPRAACTRQGLATEADPKREYQSHLNDDFPLLSQDEIERRREGLARAEAHIRPFYANFSAAKGVSVCFTEPVEGARHNCKSLPIYAVLGVPSVTPFATSSAEQIAEAFEQGVTARPGMYFAPLVDLKEFSLKRSLQDRIAASINDPSSYGEYVQSVPFKEAFTEPLASAPEFRVAKPNFPFIRNERPECSDFDPERRPCVIDDPYTPVNEAELNHRYDLRIDWPTLYETGGEPVRGQLLMDGRKEDRTRLPLDYTNPMCHHPDIPIDALNSGDPERHRVRRMLVPIIAPSTEKRVNGKPVSYCAWDETFSGYQGQSRASSVAPGPEANSVILGFTWANVYDLGLADLDRVPEFQPKSGFTHIDEGSLHGIDANLVSPNQWKRVATPFYSDPTTGQVLKDASPAFLSVGNGIVQYASKRARQFMEDHDSWEGCVEDSESMEGVRECEQYKPRLARNSFLGIPYEYLQCFDFSGIVSHPVYGNVLEAVASIQPNTCTRKIVEADGHTRTVQVPCFSKSETERDAFFNILGNFFNQEIPAQPHAHCMPREDLRNGRAIKDRNDPDYYIQPLDTTRAGFGCGGVLFKLSCAEESNGESNPFFLAGGVPWDKTKPALVSDDAQLAEFSDNP